MRYVAVVLAIILSCCTPNASYPRGTPVVHRVYHVDLTFTPEESFAIRHAVEMWMHYSDGYFEGEIVNDIDQTDPDMTSWKCRHDACILTATSSTKRIIDSDATFKDGRVTLGLAAGPHENQLLLVRDRLPDAAALGEVTMHELGHSFGIKHLTNKSAIMFPDHISANCPTRDDMEAFCQSMGCSMNRVSWCEDSRP